MESVLKYDQIPRENTVLEAKARIPLSTAHGLGAALGVYYTPSYQWGFGLAVFSPVFYNFDTILHLDTPSTVSTLGTGLKALGVDETVDMRINVRAIMPPVLQFGVSYQPYGYWQMEYFGRYAFSSLWRSLEIKVLDSSIEQAKSYVKPGHQLTDQFLAGTVQSFHLWQRWKLGVNFTYAASPVQDYQMAVSLADFDVLLSGAFLQYNWSRRWIFGIEYAHSFMLTRTASGTLQGAGTNALFPPASSDGTYRASSDRFGVMFNYAF
jgi:long-subunit fatty acid transport protein